jgi:hypothetical protein
MATYTICGVSAIGIDLRLLPIWDFMHKSVNRVSGCLVYKLLNKETKIKF